ncbi:beta-lactamase family protein [Chryseobacterium gallinarum]|uniref:serine hydrolase domain-containing protein n=1 Tax=Chryseobacterium gallinarum TaxID=1324352 RepID=UPI002023E670|nr:serine hydrolase domain-containing protein [Chryseobacterium gallinarum]MCL8538059.1 beta-lactamase family protein [Chryseobacterium gallinarum]
MENYLYCFLLFLLTSQSACGQLSEIKSDNPLQTELDIAVEKSVSGFIKKHHIFDISIGIYSQGKPYLYNYHRGKGILPTGNSYYGLGSIAKTFTGMMLANAVVEGKMHLHDDIRRFLPDHYPNLAYLNHPVRLVHLANHTSGLPSMSREYSGKEMDRITKLPPDKLEEFFRVYTSDSLLKDMHRFRLDTIPGTKYRYNGNAFMVLNTILQETYKIPYPQLVTTYLSKKYGMNHTKPFLSKADEKALLMGYDSSGKQAPLTKDEGYRAAPSMVSTTNDMLKYIKANLDDHDIVMQLSHQPTYTTPDGMQIGLAWHLGKDDRGVPYVMHTGKDGAGFTSLCYLYPTIQKGIVILTNLGMEEEELNLLRKSIIDNIKN